jgi:hypothetical protein
MIRPDHKRASPRTLSSTFSSILGRSADATEALSPCGARSGVMLRSPDAARDGSKTQGFSGLARTIRPWPAMSTSLP